MGEEISVDELKNLMTFRKHEGKEMMNTKYGGVEGLCKMLKTDPEKVLSAEEKGLKQRREKYGTNEIPSQSLKSFFELAWDAVQDITLIILIISSITSLILSFYKPPDDGTNESQWIEGAAILISVVVVVLVTALNDYTKERQFRVVGDIAQIKYGDPLPADGIIIQSNDLKIDEPSLTGGTDLILKNPLKVIQFFYVEQISWKDVVECLLLLLEFSQTIFIISLLGAAESEDDDSCGDEVENTKKAIHKKHKYILQAKLEKLAIQIGYGGFVFAIATVVIRCFRFCLSHYYLEGQALADLQYFLSFFLIGITVLVIAVPKSLPLAVTLSLAYFVEKMMKDNNLVRHINARDANCICSDKTGTLTTNRMTVIQSYIGSRLLQQDKHFISIYSRHSKLMSININSSYASQTFPTKNMNMNKSHNLEIRLIVPFLDSYFL